MSDPSAKDKVGHADPDVPVGHVDYYKGERFLCRAVIGAATAVLARHLDYDSVRMHPMQLEDFKRYMAQREVAN